MGRKSTITKRGQRVGAILTASPLPGTGEWTCLFLGWGTYQGLEVPPDDHITSEGIPVEMARRHALERLAYTDPEASREDRLERANESLLDIKIELDQGGVAWGSACWWAGAEKIATQLESYPRVVLVTPGGDIIEDRYSWRASLGAVCA